MIVNGTLDIASFEHVTSDPVTNLFKGRQIYRTDTSTAKIYNGTVWEELGSGSGGGEINYIENPDAEAGTSGWATYKDSASATPDDGTGGSPTVTFNTVTAAASVVRGTASFSFNKGALNFQGEGVSYDFSIDNADNNKLLKAEFEYYVSTNYADDDVAVFIYDVDNATLITPDDNLLKRVTGTGAENVARHSVQWNSTDSQNYRLIFHVASTSASDYNVIFDNVIVGPGQILTTPAIEGWKSFTPTLNSDTSIQTKDGKYRRVGDTMYIQVYLEYNGVGDNSDLTVDVPEGLTIDTAKINSTLVSTDNFGTFKWYDNSANTQKDGAVSYKTSTSFNFVETSGATSIQLESDQFGASDLFSASFTVPIEEWSSGSTNAIIQDNLSEWTAYTPDDPSTFSSSSKEAFWRRVGDSIEIQQIWTLSSAVSGTIVFSGDSLLPNGVTVDESKTAVDNPMGPSLCLDAGTNNRTGIAIYDDGSNGVILTFDAEAAAAGPTVPFTWTSSDIIRYTITLPVTQWAGSQNSLVGFSEATRDRSGLIPRYEQSTFSPTLTADSGFTTIDGGSVAADYTRIGNKVFCRVEFSVTAGTLSAAGSGYFGQAYFPDSELPFTNPEGVLGVTGSGTREGSGSAWGTVLRSSTGGGRIYMVINQWGSGSSVDTYVFHFEYYTDD